MAAELALLLRDPDYWRVAKDSNLPLLASPFDYQRELFAIPITFVELLHGAL